MWQSYSHKHHNTHICDNRAEHKHRNTHIYHLTIMQPINIITKIYVTIKQPLNIILKIYVTIKYPINIIIHIHLFLFSFTILTLKWLKSIDFIKNPNLWFNYNPLTCSVSYWLIIRTLLGKRSREFITNTLISLFLETGSMILSGDCNRWRNEVGDFLSRCMGTLQRVVFSGVMCKHNKHETWKLCLRRWANNKTRESQS